MGLWCSLAITFGLGPDDPGSNPGSPTSFLLILQVNYSFDSYQALNIMKAQKLFSFWLPKNKFFVEFTIFKPRTKTHPRNPGIANQNRFAYPKT